MVFDLLASEWIKLRSVRSSYWTALAAAVVAVAVAVMTTESVVGAWDRLPAEARAGFDPLWVSLSGLVLVQLVVGVLGVLAISAEHATGTIHTTFAAVPRRRTVLAAKAAVVGSVALLGGGLIAAAAFLTGQRVLAARGLGIGLWHPGVPRGLLAAGFFLCVMGLLGLGAGAVVRHTAGAVAVLFVLVFIVPAVADALPSPWDARVGAWTLTGAGRQMVALVPTGGHLGPGASALVCAGYAAAALLAAGLLVTRRDP
ncbi:MAG TPA: ABC transporter permease [Actinomycetes bacterium]|jgi:hypothetical protein|nr:ABC transporter permease [Actinomycetes bacterium]